jgi:hypothetical protein
MGAWWGVVDYSQVKRIALFSAAQESHGGLRISTSQSTVTNDKKNPACEALSTNFKHTKNDDDSIEATTQYQWIGNQWFPPPRIPRYTPQVIQDLLQGESVLFIGDSTARQDYATMFNLMNAASHEDDSSITVQNLNQGINVNKRHTTENCTLRTPEFEDMLSVCRQVPPSSRPPSISSMDISTHGGAFDLSTNPQPCNCFGNIPTFMTIFRDIIVQQYSILIFSLGIWESVKVDACPDSGIPALVQALEFLKEFTQEQNDILVVWKTHGGGELETHEERQFTSDIHRHTQRWFQEYDQQQKQQQRRNMMVLVDFGSAVRPRTYGDDRIGGDSHNHFGVDARLLSLQMMVHGMVSKLCYE